MTLDEPKERDRVFQAADMTFILDRELFALIKPVKVNGSADGFRITGRIDPGDISMTRSRCL